MAARTIADREPTLRELLASAEVHAVMRSDGLRGEDTERLIRAVREARRPRVSLLAVGASASVGFALLYLACVLADLWFPDLVMYRVWAPLLPGFEWLSWSNFFLGLVEAAAYGWLIALAFVPPYNFVSERLGP